MDIIQYINDAAKKDPTWIRAHRIVEKHLIIPSALCNLIRLGWIGLIESPEFLKLLGFSTVNPACLLNAAGLATDGRRPSAKNVENSLRILGIRYSSVILAVNATMRSILKTKPSFGWRKLFENMMTDIEIGYRFGSHASEIGLEGGVVAAFAKNAGLGMLMAHDFPSYKKYSELCARHGRVGSKLTVEIFGCEPYQVSAFLIQALGFGTDASFGIALGMGDLDASKLELREGVVYWRAAFRWIEALYAGRNYPADLKSRNAFMALRPSKEPGPKNPVLESLYAEVAKVRRQGSTWTWHLPKPDYERVRQAYGI
ncbi:MAG: hypothetical protein GX589_08725 [Deltaproteobacteria bacterium]|nr:hypothetical protein [Deltaproteobacteria bacterium]